MEVGDWVDATTPDDTAAGITRKKRTLKYVVPMNVPIPKLMADVRPTAVGLPCFVAVAIEVVKSGLKFSGTEFSGKLWENRKVPVGSLFESCLEMSKIH